MSFYNKLKFNTEMFFYLHFHSRLYLIVPSNYEFRSVIVYLFWDANFIYCSYNNGSCESFFKEILDY